MSTELNNAAVAYGEITIVDLIDNATYIYYAEDYQNGQPVNVGTQPGEKTQYIGIFNGPADTPVDETTGVPKGTQWSKYVGAKGESITIKEQQIEYVLSNDGQNVPGDDAGWSTDFPANVEQGQWLWTKTTLIFSDGDPMVSYSVSYQPHDGISATGYSLELGYTEILRFKEKTINYDKEINSL